MRHRYLRLSKIAALWSAENFRRTPQEIECRIFAAFWLGAFDEGEKSSFGWIPETGPQHGRFVSAFRHLLIGHGDENFSLGKMTGLKVRPLDGDEVEERIFGHPKSTARTVRRARVRKARKKIDRKLRTFTPVRIHLAPAVVDFVRLAREPWEFYERGKQQNDVIGQFVRNAAIRPAALVRHCQRRGIPVPLFLSEYEPISEPITGNAAADPAAVLSDEPRPPVARVSSEPPSTPATVSRRKLPSSGAANGLHKWVCRPQYQRTRRSRLRRRPPHLAGLPEL